MPLSHLLSKQVLAWLWALGWGWGFIVSAAVWDVLFLVTSVVLGEEGSLVAQANTAFSPRFHALCNL